MAYVDAVLRYMLGTGHEETHVELLVSLTRAGPSSRHSLAEVIREGDLTTALMLRYLRRLGQVASIQRAHHFGVYWTITNLGRRYLKDRGELDERAPFANFE